MLRIRRRQQDTLDAQSRAAFVLRAEDEVVSLGAPRFEGGSREDLRLWIDGRIERASAFGLDDERILLAWLEVAAFHGDDFAEDAFVVHTLADPAALFDWRATRALIDAIADPTTAPSEDAS